MQYCRWVIKKHPFKTMFLVMLPNYQNRSFSDISQNGLKCFLEGCLSKVQLWLQARYLNHQ